LSLRKVLKRIGNVYRYFLIASHHRLSKGISKLLTLFEISAKDITK